MAVAVLELEDQTAWAVKEDATSPRAINIAQANGFALFRDEMGPDVWKVLDVVFVKSFGIMPISTSE